jgi:hypothetical protein
VQANKLLKNSSQSGLKYSHRLMTILPLSHTSSFSCCYAEPTWKHSRAEIPKSRVTSFRMPKTYPTITGSKKAATADGSGG